MKSKKYLNVDEVVALYFSYKKTGIYDAVARRFNVSGTTVATWVRDIDMLLAGHKVRRVAGRSVLDTAVVVIRDRQAAKVPGNGVVKVSGSVAEAKARVDLAFHGLMQEVAEYSQILVNEKYRSLVDENKQLREQSSVASKLPFEAH